MRRTRDPFRHSTPSDGGAARPPPTLNRRTDEWQHLDPHARVRGRAEVPNGAAEGPADPAHDAGALHWHARYDPNGNVVERTDPRGIPVASTYGVLDRLETETFPPPTLQVAYPYPLDVTYAYDGTGNLDLVTERKQTAPGSVVIEVKDPEHDDLDRLDPRTQSSGVRPECPRRGPCCAAVRRACSRPPSSARPRHNGPADALSRPVGPSRSAEA